MLNFNIRALKYFCGTLFLLFFSIPTAAQVIEKSHITSDKQLYSPGDTLWFKAYVFNDLNQLSDKSVAYHLLMADSAGNKKVDTSWPIQNAISEGFIPLPKEEGMYTLMGVSGQMIGGDPDQFFSKTIYIKSDEPDIIDIRVFPRFKSFHADSTNQVDVYALDVNDKPIKGVKLKYSLFNNKSEITEGKLNTNKKGLASIQLDDIDYKSGNLTLLTESNERKFYQQVRRTTLIHKEHSKRIDLQFFPEGGHLVSGLENIIAFKAMDEFGESVNVKGLLIDKNGNILDSISSYHNGMGKFNFKPNLEEQYQVKITTPEHLNQVFDLPLSVKTGITFQKESLDQGAEILKIKASPDLVNSPAELHLLNSKDNLLMKLPFNLTQEVPWKIPQEKLPAGIYKVRVVTNDKKNISERLIFGDSQDRLNISIDFNKDTYLPREEVKTTLKVTNSEGKPIQGSFSFAAVHKQMAISPVDNQPNLMSQILINSELKGKIEDPNFFFGDDPKASGGLELVLLTHGWRKHTSSTINDPEAIIGKLNPVLSQKAVINKEYSLINQFTGEINTLRTNESGEFGLSADVVKSLGGSITLLIEKSGEDDVYRFKRDESLRTKRIKSLINGMSQSSNKNTHDIFASNLKDYKRTALEVNGNVILNSAEIKSDAVLPKGSCELEDKYFESPWKTKVVEELDLSENDIMNWIQQVSDQVKGYGMGYASDRITRAKTNQVLMKDAIVRSRFPYFYGLTVNCKPILSFKGTIDVTNYNPSAQAFETLSQIDWSNLASISVADISESQSLVQNDSRGMKVAIPKILIRTKDLKEQWFEGSNNKLVYRAFANNPITYYSPKYTTDDEKDNPIPDLRTTLYWQANIITNAQGEADISFYNGDRLGSIKIFVEGIDVSSKMGFVEGEFNVVQNDN